MTDFAHLASPHVAVRDFSDRTLLIWGSAGQMDWLRGQLEGKRDISIVMEAPVNARFVLTFGRTTASMVREHDGAVEVALSDRDRLDLTGKLKGMTAASGPGHNYLDVLDNPSDLAIVVSKDEY